MSDHVMSSGDGHTDHPTGSPPPTAAAPLPPPPPTVPVAATAVSGDGRGRRSWPLVLAVVLVMALAGGLAGWLLWPSEADAGEIFLEPAVEPGLDPFFVGAQADVLDVTLAGVTSDRDSVADATEAAVTRSVSGGSVGLYGGSLNTSVCDPLQQLTFLSARPDVANAFVTALNADPSLRWQGGGRVRADDLGGYFAELTPVTLTSDTRVTNHGLVDGQPTARQSVLQAGTAVLVDRYGVPRVRCACGNPLTQPVAYTVRAVYVGDSWEWFDPVTVVVVAEVNIAIDHHVLIDLNSGDAFVRPAGTTGVDDRPELGVVPPPTDATVDDELATGDDDPTATEVPTSTEAPAIIGLLELDELPWEVVEEWTRNDASFVDTGLEWVGPCHDIGDMEILFDDPWSTREPWCGEFVEQQGEQLVFRVADYPGGHFSLWLLAVWDGHGWHIVDHAWEGDEHPFDLAAAPAVSPAPAPATAPVGVAAQDTDGGWNRTAFDYRRLVGQRISFRCDQGGRGSVVWGTDVYTDDSSVCTAAVHAGVIGLGDSATVVIEMLPGQSSYRGSERNGVVTQDWATSWPGSFAVVGRE